jgi:hypothetical protein
MDGKKCIPPREKVAVAMFGSRWAVVGNGDVIARRGGHRVDRQTDRRKAGNKKRPEKA